MSEEEVPFKSLKITLSDDVLEKLALLLRTGSFRSQSSTIEECIRAVYDVSLDMVALLNTVPQAQTMLPAAQQEAFRRYMMRMMRFVASRVQQK
ncbi:hypothetical protein MUP77_00310 [Candidatus Bathyarchaeota archaeon]|nr:hypothetical protein [Candidatus Bathyarchaeota archaeon]